MADTQLRRALRVSSHGTGWPATRSGRRLALPIAAVCTVGALFATGVLCLQPKRLSTPKVILAQYLRNTSAGYAVAYPAGWRLDTVPRGWDAVFSELESDRPAAAWLEPAWAAQGVQVVVQCLPEAGAPLPAEQARRLDVPRAYTAGVRELEVMRRPALAFAHREAGRWEELVIVCPPGRLLLVHIGAPLYREADAKAIWEALLASLEPIAVSWGSADSVPVAARDSFGIN